MKEELFYIKERISTLQLDISDGQAEQFYRYYEILTEWNQVMNLTGITDFKEVVEKHFVDSLSIIFVKNPENTDNLIDVGTGAGFPGIPLKIVFPRLKVTLLDSLNKRVRFLNEVIDTLGLRDIEAIHGRAEDYAKHGVRRECFTLCVSRAVANLSTLCEYCLPFVRIGGEFISYKSADVSEELENAQKAITLLGGKLEECKVFSLPDSEIQRSLLMIKKIKSCPRKYPRKSGLPLKNPLV